MLKKYRYILLFFLPFILKLIVKLFFVRDATYTTGDIFEDCVFSFLILFFLLNTSASYRYVQIALMSVYVLYFVLEISSLLIIESNFSASFMFALLDTNSIELFDFFESYFRLKNIIIILLLLCAYLLLIRRNYFLLIKTSLFKVSFLNKLLVGFACVIFLKISGCIEYNAYYNIVRGSYGYYQLNSRVSSTTSIDENKVIDNSSNEVLVVVLGESISKRHMQLYNYHRTTTPLLFDAKDDLMVYNNVIAPEVLTTKVIPKLLTTMSNSETVEQLDNIIEILNYANYDTYWISNQRPIGFHENVVSQLVSVSKHVDFLAYKSHLEHTNLDEVVLPVLKNTLNNKGKKVIFVHLIGAHFKYNNRYPNRFEVFNTNNVTSEQEIINHYDNAVLYNDFIVHSILEEVKLLDQKSAVLFLSDHGEDVFDESNFSGHTEANITKSMVEIPFILWTSKDYDFPIDFEYVPDRKFMTDYFYSSLGHLLGVSYPSIENNRSIFSTSYQGRIRIINHTFNYDSFDSK